MAVFPDLPAENIDPWYLPLSATFQDVKTYIDEGDAAASAGDLDRVNIRADHGAVGDAIKVTGDVTGTALTITSGTIPSGWNKTALIETAGAGGLFAGDGFTLTPSGHQRTADLVYDYLVT